MKPLVTRWSRGKRALFPVIGLLLAMLVLGGCSLFKSPTVPDPPDEEPDEGSRVEYVADFTVPGVEWALTQNFAVQNGALITQEKSGEAILVSYDWDEIDITTEFVVSDFGQSGTFRIHFGWRGKWESYAVVFARTLTRILRYDGDHSDVVSLASTTDFVLTPNQTYTARVVVADGKITLYVDGEKILEGSDPEGKYPYGYVGLEAGNDIAARVTHFAATGTTVKPTAGPSQQYSTVFSSNDGWALSGGIRIEGNALVVATAGTAILQGYEWERVEIDATAKVNSYGVQNGNLRFVLGRQAGWTNFAVQFHATQIRILRYDGGWDKVSIVNQKSIAIPTDTESRIKIKAHRGIIEVFVDGEKVLSGIDASGLYRTGQVGIEGGNDISAVVTSFSANGTRPL